jgi:hypothetical protein
MSGAAADAWTSRRGVALPLAVFTLVVLAALLAGLWFAALQEYRIGGNAVRDRRAFDAAETGLDAAIAGWDAATLNRLGVNDSTAFSGSLGGGTGAYAGIVLRLGPSLYLVRSTGRDAGGSSRRTLAVVARLAPPRLAVPAAALVAAGPVRLRAGALVDALNADSGAACPPQQAPAAGVVLGDAGDLSLSGCADGDCLRGSPPSRVDPTIGDSLLPLLGEAGWTDLAADADTLGPGRDPSPSVPVWYAAGDFSPQPGTAVGPVILLVQGDLILETGAQLSGVALVRGSLIMRGAGGRFAGSVVARGADLSVSGGATATLVYSGCAVGQALSAAAPARPLRERAWTAIY